MKRLAIALGMLALCAGATARAELVDALGKAPGIASEAPVFEDVQFITGNATLATQFAITTAGTYTVTLTDLEFPSAFQTLSLAITSATTILGSLSAPGAFDLVLDGPTQLFALVFGVPDADPGVGLYGVRVALAADGGGGGGEVPVPAAAWLLLSALATLLARSLHRRSA